MTRSIKNKGLASEQDVTHKTPAFLKIDRNTYRHSVNANFEVRIYAVDGFYGADLWYGEDDFVSLCAHRLRRDVLEEVTELITEWSSDDIIQIFKNMYLNEYCRIFEMKEATS